jgi:hypothetical protein
MAGPGDIDGNVSGEEAAWLELVARLQKPGQLGVASPWPASEDLSDGDTVGAEPSSPAASQLGEDPGGNPGNDLGGPVSAAAVFTGDPRSYSPAEEEDEPYVPPPLPPPPRMDPVSKGAWVALICGPAYLLLGTLLGWTISGTEALVAIAAFIGGFIVLVVKMGDRPSRDDDDDGAVI